MFMYIKKNSLQVFNLQGVIYLLSYSKRDLNPHSHYWPRDFKSLVSTDSTIRAAFQRRAENETRTRDPNLGKVMLYQLSYFRVYGCKCREPVFFPKINVSVPRVRVLQLPPYRSGNRKPPPASALRCGRYTSYRYYPRGYDELPCCE